MKQPIAHSHNGRRLSCLGKVPIFARLDEQTSDTIRQLIHPSYYQKGEIIQQSGDSQPRLLVLNRGRAKVVRTASDGRQQIISWLEPGDFSGEVTVFTGQPTDNEIIALEDSSFCTINGAELKAVLANSPDLSLAVIEQLSQRLSSSAEQIESLSLLPASQKILQRLRQLAAGRLEFDLPMSKQDLAAELGITPETLSRQLRKLSDEGHIALTGTRTIQLLSYTESSEQTNL